MDYKTAVVAVVEHEGKILIGRKIKTDHVLSEEWHVPGGSVKEGELEEEAVVREMIEEAGIKVKVNKFIDETLDVERNFRVRWFLCNPLSHDLKAGDDLQEVKYVLKKDVAKHCCAKANSLWPAKVVEYFGY